MTKRILYSIAMTLVMLWMVQPAQSSPGEMKEVESHPETAEHAAVQQDTKNHLTEESKDTSKSEKSGSEGFMSWLNIYEQIVSHQTPAEPIAVNNTAPAQSHQMVSPQPGQNLSANTVSNPAMTGVLGIPSRLQGNTPVDSNNYLIHVGDKLGYRIVEDQDEPRMLTVSPAGDIEVPFLGRVKVSGKLLNEAAKMISSMLEKDLYRQATVVLSIEDSPTFHLSQSDLSSPGGTPGSQSSVALPPRKPNQITIVGQVRSQGVQDMPLDEPLMLSRAILKAGGFASFANAKKVKVVRRRPDGSSEIIYANVLDVLEEGKLDADVELKPDDMIIVREKWFNF